MRFSRLFLNVALLTTFVQAFAQPTAPALRLRGRVIDAATRQAIPGAHLRVGKVGTATNADGRFELRLPAESRTDRLVVSYIGYQNLERPVTGSLDRDLTLALTEAPHQLAEAKVYASARAIVADAVARIPQNYPIQPVRLTAFYREANRMFPGGRYTYLAEGLLELFKPPYDRPKQGDQTRVVQYRKRELMPFDSVQIRWVQGATFGEWADFVRSRIEFLTEREHYDYRLIDITTYDGRDAYAIGFEPKGDRGKHRGTLYVALDGLALVAAEWRNTEAALKRRSDLSTAYRKAERKVEYQFFNGRWYLQRATNETVIEQVARKREHRVSDELVVTDFDTTTREGFRYTEIVQSTDAFSNLETPYDSTFWSRYNVTLQNDDLARQLQERGTQAEAQRVFSRPDSAVQPPSPKTSWAASRRPLRWRGYGGEWALSLVGAEATGSGARVGFQAPDSPFGFNGSVGLTSRPLALLSYSTTHWFGKGGFLGFRLATTPFAAQGGYRLSQRLLRAGWRWNLNPTGRPIRLEVGVGFGSSRLSQFLGRFDNPDASLRIDDRRFNAPVVEARLQRSITQAMPSLGLSVEVSRRREFFLEATYLLALAERERLILREGRGVFPQTARLNLPHSSVLVPADQVGGAVPFDLRHGQVRAGIRFKRLYR